MRKSNYIKRLSEQDIKLLYIVKNSQHISREQAENFVSRHRLDNYVKQGIFKRIHCISERKPLYAFELTNIGREFIKAKIPGLGTNFYISSTAVAHNVRLAQSIIEHEQERGRTWLNEMDLREIFMERIERESPERRFELIQMLERGCFSVTDGGYFVGDELVLIEHVTTNYSSEQIEAKANFSDYMNSSRIEYISK